MSVGAGAIRAGLAVVELSGDTGPLDAALNVAATRLKGFAGKLAKIGVGVAGLGLSVVGPIAAAFKGAVDQAAGMDTLATQLGLTTQKASALTYALGTIGIEEGELIGFTKHLNSAFSAAADGSQEAIQGFARLGLNWQELARMPLDERLLAVKEALGKITNDFDRSTQAAHYFGKRGLELLKLSTEDLRRRMAEAQDVGAIVSPEQAAQAKEVQRAWAQIGSSIKYAFLEIGRALLPHAGEIKKYAASVVNIARMVRQWISANKPLVAGILVLGAGLAAAGSALVALGVVGASVGGILAGAAAMIGAAWSALSAVVGAVVAAFTPLGLKVAGAVALAVAALAVVAAGIAYVVQNWDKVKAAAVAAWEATVAALQAAWAKVRPVLGLMLRPLIIAGGAAVIAIGVVIAAVRELVAVWPKVQAAAQKVSGAIVAWFQAGWARIRQITADLVASIEAAWVRTWQRIEEQGNNSYEGIARSTKSVWSKVSSSLGAIFGEVANQGAQAWATLKETALMSWSGIVSALKRGDLQSVWAILQAGFEVAWRQIQASFSAVWRETHDRFLDGWGDATVALQALFANTLAAIARGFTAMLRRVIDDLSGLARRVAPFAGLLGGRALRGLAGALQERRPGEGAEADIEAQRKRRIAEAEEGLEEAKRRRAEASAEERARRQSAVDEARERLKAILEEERKRAGVAGGKGGAAGLPGGVGIQQAAREVRGTFGVGLTSSASAQQALAVGNTPAARELVDEAKKSNGYLGEIAKYARGGFDGRIG